MIDRRILPFPADEAKFATQRMVTYIILLFFAAVTTSVLSGVDQAERSTIIQTVINFTMLAIGFWLGTSKQGQDQAQSANKIAEATAAVPHVPAVTPAPMNPETGVVPAAEVVADHPQPKGPE